MDEKETIINYILDNMEFIFADMKPQDVAKLFLNYIPMSHLTFLQHQISTLATRFDNDMKRILSESFLKKEEIHKEEKKIELTRPSQSTSIKD